MKKKNIAVLLLTTLMIGSAVPAAAAPCCGGRGSGPRCGQNYVDANGDGVCDNFVDNNGDGINDNCPGYGQGWGQGQRRGQGGAGAAGSVQNTAVKNAAATKVAAKKNTIKKVQRRLNKIGYPCGKVNGIMNAKTCNALREFKSSEGLKANNVINQSTLKALGIA